MGLIDQILSALVLLVCTVLLVRLLIGARRRGHFDAACRKAWNNLRARFSRRRPATAAARPGVRVVRAGTATTAAAPKGSAARGQIITLTSQRRSRATPQEISQAAAREAEELIERARRAAAGPGNRPAPDGDSDGKVLRHPRNLH
jgi:hypothetical protein